MLYFATPSSKAALNVMVDGRLGYIDTPRQGNRRPAGVTWCADNGRYGKGWPGYEAWWAWLERNAHDAPTCLFATAPDVVGDAVATLADSLPWLPRIRALGYPAALVAQDGLELLDVPWDDFDVLFLGGSTEWKLGQHAWDLTAEAKRRGKHVHMGRVNSLKRYAIAADMGCDSCDGTKLAFGPDINLPIVLGWAPAIEPGPGDTYRMDL